MKTPHFFSAVTHRPTHLVQTITPPPPTQPQLKKNNHSKTFSFPTVELFELSRNVDVTKKKTFLNSGKMCLTTDIHTHTHTHTHITHLLRFGLYIRKRYIFRNLLLFDACRHLFIYSYGTLFYDNVLFHCCIADITCTIRWCWKCLTRRTWQNVQRICAAL